MRKLFVISVLLSVIDVQSASATACATDGPVSQVGSKSSSSEQSTFGYACVDEEQPNVRVLEEIRGMPIMRLGAETGEPEKETYGYSPRK